MAYDPVVTQARLDEAQLAYHKLQTGSLRETVDHNGTRIQYSRADAAKLKSYIDDLEGLIAEGLNPPRRRRVITSYY